jgi:hypothetical protein
MKRERGREREGGRERGRGERERETEGERERDLSVFQIVCGDIGTTPYKRVRTVAFPWQKWVHESVTILRYTYMAFLLNICRCSYDQSFRGLTFWQPIDLDVMYIISQGGYTELQ